MVGPVPGTGLRGTIATEDIPAGEVALAVPAGLCVQLGDAASQGAVRHSPCSKHCAGAGPWPARQQSLKHQRSLLLCWPCDAGAGCGRAAAAPRRPGVDRQARPVLGQPARARHAAEQGGLERELPGRDARPRPGAPQATAARPLSARVGHGVVSIAHGRGPAGASPSRAVHQHMHMHMQSQ